MKTSSLTWIITLAVLAALALPVRLTAQEQKEQKTGHRHYQLVDVGTFGGPNSSYVIGPPVSRLLEQQWGGGGWGRYFDPRSLMH